MEVLEGALCTARTACSTARRCSSSTTPSDSRSTSPRTSPASAACRSIWPVSKPRCSSSASGRARLPSSSMTQGMEYTRQGHRVPRLRDAQARRHGGGALRRRLVGRSPAAAASAASWCSTARRSMPSPAARLAIAACWCGTLADSSFKVEDTQKIQAEVFGHHGVVTSGELRLGDTVSAEVDIGAARMRRCSTTRRRTSCTRRCARCWATTCSRRARWWTSTRPASTSPTTGRSRPRKSARSSGW